MSSHREEGCPPTGTGAGPAGSATGRRWVVAVRGDRWSFVDDAIVSEASLEIRDQAGPLAALACTPENLDELVLGFLYTHGAIAGLSSIAGIAMVSGAGDRPTAIVTFKSREDGDHARRMLAETRFVVSGCGQPGRIGGPPGRQATACAGNESRSLQPRIVAHLARLIQGASPVFAATGGVHASALVNLPLAGTATPEPPELLALREDIGRHNTVDKIVGWCLNQGVSTADKALVVTGRISADLVQKARTAGFNVVVSRSAPTATAIDIAEEAGLTLIGFARHDRFNIYSNWWRIELPQPPR